MKPLAGVHRLISSTRAPFSTSTPRWPRTRPLAGRPRPQQEPQRAEEDAQREDQAQSDTDRSTAPQAPSPPAPLRRRSAPAHMSPAKRDFWLADVIRQGPEPGSPVTSEASTARELTAARFFAPRVRFLYSAGASLRDHPKSEGVPEVVVLGASNAGKSTLLNALVGEAGAARVSARPGRTTVMNAFGVGPAAGKGMPGMPGHSLVVLDTPGYGYKSRASWGDAVVRYMRARGALRGAVVLLASEKKVSEGDRWVLRALGESGTRTMVVLTKADKGGREWRERCGELAERVREEVRTVKGRGEGWDPWVYVTAAGLDKVPPLGNGGGVGGVRAAILEMAGFTLEGGEARRRDETVAYTGEVVAFDDIKWKT